MTDRDEQLERLQGAVQRRMREAEAASRADRSTASSPPRGEDGPGTPRSPTETGRTQDALSVRDRNSQKGKKTADKRDQ